MKKLWVFLFLFLHVITTPTAFAQAPERNDAEKTLRKAVGFYREKVATEGGFLWKYSSDLKFREGENVADDRTVWVQPPGTPTVGMVLLRAYRATGDRYYLEAATEAGHCLVRGQLRSGGWTYPIYFDEARRKTYAYRVDPVEVSPKGRNISTLDDNTTQSATVFLMELDESLDFKDAQVHDAAVFALEKLLEAQFPNGAFPQTFRGEKRDPAKYPVKAANYPPDGTEPTHEKDYHVFYTFNDGLARDINRCFFVAAEIYGTKQDGKTILNKKYVEAARKLGNFIISAQMPEPQPAWAQQYDFEMRPCWARKFEPAAVTGGESQGIIDALIELYYFTGDKAYLEPIQKAVAYLERSRLPNGKVARFYELKTNKPLFFTKKYELTYSDADLPTHYVFSVPLGSWPTDTLLKMDEPERQKRSAALRERYRGLSFSKPKPSEAAKVIQSLDERGAWITQGMLKSNPSETPIEIIDNGVFARNVNVLLSFLNKK